MWAISVAGMAMSAYATIREGEQAAELGEAKQEAYEGEAQAVVMTGAEASRLKREWGRKFLATQISRASWSGGLVGSNLVIMAESARRIEVDASTIERNAQTRAKFLRTRGKFAKYEGQLARSSARIRAFAGGMKGAGQLYGMYSSGSFSSGSSANQARFPGYYSQFG